MGAVRAVVSFSYVLQSSFPVLLYFKTYSLSLVLPLRLNGPSVLCEAIVVVATARCLGV